MPSTGTDKYDTIVDAVLHSPDVGGTEADQSFDAVVAPVRNELADVLRSLEDTLSSEIPTVDTVGKYVAKTRGKGIRPALVLLSAKAVGHIPGTAHDAALGIELLQTSTLLHDDVIDEADTRRGSPSVNMAWDNGVAILMGDILFIRALERFLSTRSLPVMDIAAARTRAMIEGEILGRDIRNAPDFAEATYFEVIRRKTGSLMSLASETGALLAGATDTVCAHMRRYGELVGMAFQIVDDVLDVIGSPDIVGKPTGRDIREGTVTLPLIRAINSAAPANASELRQAVESGIKSDREWDYVRHFIDEHEGVEAATGEALRLLDDARQELSIVPDSEARASLSTLLDYILARRL
jgi:octaprenyl-diphosphate synthase